MGLIQTPDQLKFSYLSIMEVPWKLISFSFIFLSVGSQAVGFDRLYSWVWGTCCRGINIQENRSIWNIRCFKSLELRITWTQGFNDEIRQVTLIVRKRCLPRYLLQELSPWKRRWPPSAIPSRSHLEGINLANHPLGGDGWWQCSNHHRRRAVQFNRLQVQSGTSHWSNICRKSSPSSTC